MNNTKKYYKLIFLLILPLSTYAHTLILNVFNNDNNTITVEGAFNTGQSAAGALIILEALNTGEVLYKKRLPDDSQLIIEIPKVPYQIVLDGGPAHQVIKPGIGVINTLKKETIKNDKVKLSQSKVMVNNTNPIVTISIICAFSLLFATIFISIRNTNKLLIEIKKKK